MNLDQQESETKSDSCPVGGCGTGNGMCPGLAIGIALLSSMGVKAITGIEWLSTGSGVIIALLLLIGFYPGGGRWPTMGK